MKKRGRLALTLGDPAGIGPEVAARSVAAGAVPAGWSVLLVGDAEAWRGAAGAVGAPMPPVLDDPAAAARAQAEPLVLLTPPPGARGPFPAARPSAESGRSAFAAVRLAADLALAGAVDALVTGPVSKEAIVAAGFPFVGHTEYLARHASRRRATMMFVAPRLRVSLVTDHVPLRKVPFAVTAEAVAETVTATAHALQTWFGLARARIAVCGLNPHAGEHGLFGREEEAVVAPGIAAADAPGCVLAGPLPADTAFARAVAGEFDAVVALYHDQALIPVKLLDFDRAVNVTLGLPYVRTSVSHGVAYDLVGKGLASAGSMTEAIRLATRLVPGGDELF